jgi:hypothetical protein
MYETFEGSSVDNRLWALRGGSGPIWLARRKQMGVFSDWLGEDLWLFEPCADV